MHVKYLRCGVTDVRNCLHRHACDPMRVQLLPCNVKFFPSRAGRLSSSSSSRPVTPEPTIIRAALPALLALVLCGACTPPQAQPSPNPAAQDARPEAGDAEVAVEAESAEATLAPRPDSPEEEASSNRQPRTSAR